MADLEMRPRFAVDVRCDAHAVVEALRAQLPEADPPLEGSFDPAHCVLGIPRERRALWSPELDLTFEPLEDGAPGVRVRCLFAPRPPVWTGFVFLYAALGAAGLLGALVGLAQLTLGQPPWALAALPLALVGMGGVYAATFVGRGLAAAQMYELRRHLDAGLARAEARARRTPRTSLDGARL